MTANDDKLADHASLLSFVVNQPVNIYIAHDTRYEEENGREPPTWLTKYYKKVFTENSEKILSIQLSGGEFLNIWQRKFNTGKVIIPGNAHDTPTDWGDSTNYMIIFRPAAEIDLDEESITAANLSFSKTDSVKVDQLFSVLRIGSSLPLNTF